MIGIELLLFLGVPLALLWGAKRFTWIEKISPVVLCYGAGLILGNIPGGDSLELAKPLSEATVPLAIPLLLFVAHVPAWLRLAPSTLLAFGLMLVSVTVASTSAFFLFKETQPAAAEAAAMMMGIYTGGTPNLTAIGMSLSVDESMIVLMNASDIVVGGIYLLFALTLGKRIVAWMLPPFQHQKKYDQNSVSTQLGPWWRWGFVFLLSGSMVGLAVLSSNWFFGYENVAYILLLVTTLGLLGSFTTLHSFEESTILGNYLLLVFCMAIGSLADIGQLYTQSIGYLGFVTFCLLSTVFLHLILCRLFRIDRDTAMITSIAGLYGPAFIGPMAAAIKNEKVLVSGLTTGLIGYAVGNYLGLLFYYVITH